MRCHLDKYIKHHLHHSAWWPLRLLILLHYLFMTLKYRAEKLRKGMGILANRITCLYVACREKTDLPAAPLQVASDSWASAKDLHNLYRIRTLTDKALQERIYTIRRIGKLESFIKVSLLCVSVDVRPHADFRLIESRAWWLTTQVADGAFQ